MDNPELFIKHLATVARFGTLPEDEDQFEQALCIRARPYIQGFSFCFFRRKNRFPALDYKL